MNFVYLSPHFPPNYFHFCVSLREYGVNVLGIGEDYFDNLRPELKWALNEYYRVDDMHVYEDLLRACGYFTHRYGKIDRVDSHNEYWLETEARLRTDFNVFGIKIYEIANIKRKSRMKEIFRKAGIGVPEGEVVRNAAEAEKLIGRIGYPVIVKPDAGVGAAATYKLHSREELKNFFATKPDVDYIMEEFIDGDILTFDGLTDKDGHPVFTSSMQYSQGIMETVNDDLNVYYYTLREIPKDIEEAGLKTVRAFGVRERFFHFEFFRRKSDGAVIGLEVNMRPPGGLTTDMFNFSNDIDIYRQWANVIVNNRFDAGVGRMYHCAYIGRKSNKNYAHTHEQILQTLGNMLIHHERIFSIFSQALGDYGYLVRSASPEDIHAAAKFIHQ